MVFVFEQKLEKTNYLVGGAWSELTKKFKEYHKAESLGQTEKMEKLGIKINMIQKYLGLKQTEFTTPPQTSTEKQE